MFKSLISGMAFLLMGLLYLNNLVGQDSDASETKENDDFLAQMEPDFRLFWREMSTFGLKTDALGNFEPHVQISTVISTLTPLILEPKNREDLELTKGQLTRIETLLEKVRPMVGRASSLDLRNKTEESEELIDEINALVNQEVARVLIPHQVERLRQLALRKYVRGMGLVYTLNHSKLSEYLKISETQKEKINSTAEDQYEKNEKRMEEFCDNLQDEILGALSAEKRRKLKDLLARPLRNGDPEIDLLAFQLESFASSFEKESKLKNVPFGLSKHQFTPEILFGMNLLMVPSREKEFVVREGLISIGDRGTSDPALSLLTNPKVQKEIEFGQHQKQALEEDVRILKEAIWQRYYELSKSFNETEVETKLAEEFNDDRRAIVQKHTLEHQLDWLDNIKLHRTVRIVGLPWLLKMNALKGVSPLTAEETKSLVELCEKKSAEARVLANSIDSETFDKITKSLSDSQRETLEKLMGEGTHFETPWVGRTQYQLKYGDQDFWRYNQSLRLNKFGETTK